MNFVIAGFGKIIKPLFNIGLGQILVVRKLYMFIWKYFGCKGVRLIEVNGLKLYIVCRDWAVAPTMLFAHTWEPEETKLCQVHIKAGMNVIDAGAYIGYYSILASKLVGDKGKVYSFEPSPECLELLYKNIEINECKNIRVFEKALMDKVDQSTFYLSPQNLSGSTMFENYSTQGNIKDPQIEISTTTLDEEIGDEKVDFIKMDIEGGEVKALAGMERIIDNNPNLKMIIEVFPIGLDNVGSSLEEFIGFLQKHFHLYIVGQRYDEVGLADIQEATRKTAVINIFCLRRKVSV